MMRTELRDLGTVHPVFYVGCEVEEEVGIGAWR
jgi:hypothetical protein